MTPSEFLSAEFDPTAPLALQSLWQMAHGNWQAAHALIDTAEDRDSMWVHAHLHRVEGDEWNAGYWYRKAGKPVSKDALEVEREAIVATLLAVN